MDKKINYKVIIAFFVLFGIALIMYFFPAYSENLLKMFFESKFIFFSIGAITIIIYILYFFFSTDKDYNLKPFITPYFGHFFDIIIGGTSVAVGLTSALTLIKGFYLQQYFNIIYFTEFDVIDKWIILLTMCFLEYFLIIKVINVVKELIWVERITKIE